MKRVHFAFDLLWKVLFVHGDSSRRNAHVTNRESQKSRIPHQNSLEERAKSIVLYALAHQHEVLDNGINNPDTLLDRYLIGQSSLARGNATNRSVYVCRCTGLSAR